MKRWMRALMIVFGVLLVAGLAVMAYRASLVPAEMSGAIVAPTNVSLRVASQTSPAGLLVVSEVRVPDASWIVVSTTDDPSFVAGKLLVRAGTSRNVTVPLDPSLAMNLRLKVTVNVDRGIPGRFEFDESRYEASPDKPYFMNGKPLSAAVVKDTNVQSLAEAGGAVVGDEIAVTADQAVLDVSDRLTVIDEIVVDRVVAPGPSWVVAYLVSNAGRPTRVAGLVQVPAGESMSVVIPVAPDLELTDKLLVALQTDAGTPGVLDFVPSRFALSADKPYAVAGTELSRSVLLRGYGMDFDNTAGGGSGM